MTPTSRERPQILSDRVRGLPEYLFARVNAIKAAARTKGIDVIDLGMGNPDKPPAPFIVDKLCEAAHDPKAHRYSASRGIPHLRRAIAKGYQERFGVELDPEREAIVTIGSKEGLTHLMYGMLNEGDTILVPSPTYPIHTYGVLLAGGRPVTVPLGDPETLVDRFAAALKMTTPRPRFVLCSFPHNPTTAIASRSFYEKLVAFAKAEGLFVIHDLAYGDIVFDGYKATSFLEIPGAKDVGVEFFSMTKSYNMAGWRVGFMVGNADGVAALTKIKSYLDYGIFTPIAVAAITALREGLEPCREAAETYRQRMEILADGLEKQGWVLTRPKATMYVWARLPEAFLPMGSMKFAEKLLEEAAVAVSPGPGFGPEGEGYVRFALVENEERIKQALRNMRKLAPPAGGGK